MYRGYIYGIQCTVTNKMYIGQTTQTVEKRLHRHFMSATKGSNFNIHQAMRKYGFEKFEIEELECIESNTPQELISDLNVLEQFYIKYYDTKHNGYNMTDGGEGTRGRIYSEKERGCFISRMKRLWDNKEYCNHLSDAAVKRFANNSERQKQSERIKTFHSKNPLFKEEAKLAVKQFFSIKENREAQAERCRKQWKTQKEEFTRGLRKAQRSAAIAKRKTIVQMDLNGNELREFSSIKEAMQFVGGFPNIGACCKGKLKHETAGGYKWKYKD